MYQTLHKHGVGSIVTKLALGLFALPLASSHPNNLEARASIQDCLTQHGVPFQDSSSPSWSQTISPYNLRLPYTPVIYALPTTSQQVRDAVTCAAAGGFKVQARCGGHSYAGLSLGGKDGAVVISLENLNLIYFDTDINVALVGGGVRLGNLALELYKQAKQAIPHGTCLGVGVGGHISHGGFGLSSRAWGLSLDTIIGLDVVLADGSQVHATATEHPDIFYALRGAAESFGIIVAFYLKTFEAPSKVVTFQIVVPDVLKDVDTAVSTFTKLQEFALDAKRISKDITFGIYTDNGGAFSLSGWCLNCDEAEFNKTTFTDLLSVFPAPESTSVKTLGWLDALVSANNGGALEQPLSGYAAHDTFYAKSIVTKNANPLTTAQLTSYFSFIMNEGKKAPSTWYTIINLYGGPGSQINVPSPDSSAYSDRDALWVFQNYGVTKAGEWKAEIIPFVNSLNEALSAKAPNDFGIYLNYVDSELKASDVARLGYGQATYDKLLAIKKTVDPNKVFWNPQAIGADDDEKPTKETSYTVTAVRADEHVRGDGTCGGIWQCPSGNCCSSHGYCGSGDSYCPPGTGGGGTPIPAGACGKDYNKKCSDGNCCSSYGFCGTSSDYCGIGCQSAFGRCN
ncbi:hypothetical protein DSL72_008639 [Monilinia vaccinii-corymbosi]|uniref:FAD-binding PCMH-type domain-containing protein n=1 Tax=Monilinia vaccinii-corymbosi TaxID=61207 RepID=A0A8A3PRT0_9HELO|nr:hypothetical protein DSL72_008639 [Monilinia vaccinii-corymbosi]